MRLLIPLFLILATSVSSQQNEAVTEADGVDFEQAIAALRSNISDSSDPLTEVSQKGTVEFTQRSLNGYLRFQGNSFLPSGLSDVTVEIQQDGRLRGTGVLDLDEMDDFADGSSGVLQLLSGSLPVSVSVLVVEADRDLEITVESVQIGPVTLPTALAEILVRRYSVSESYPAGLDLSVPIALPPAVKDIQIQQSLITIVTQ